MTTETKLISKTWSYFPDYCEVRINRSGLPHIVVAKTSCGNGSEHEYGEFIVRACQSHNTLVRALKQVLEGMQLKKIQDPAMINFQTMELELLSVSLKEALKQAGVR